jgi:hypothetical protein
MTIAPSPITQSPNEKARRFPSGPLRETNPCVVVVELHAQSGRAVRGTVVMMDRMRVVDEAEHDCQEG